MVGLCVQNGSQWVSEKSFRRESGQKEEKGKTLKNMDRRC